MKRMIVFVMACVVVLFCLNSEAVVREDNYYGEFDSGGNVLSGGGSGYQGGTWFAYPQNDGPTWWNQWFYNDPPSTERWKWIEWGFELRPANDFNPINEVDNGIEIPLEVEVAINWTLPEYSNPDAPPMAADDALIVRETVFRGLIGGFYEDSEPTGPPMPNRIVIEDYNPEWVSIDVRVWSGETVFIQTGPAFIIY